MTELLDLNTGWEGRCKLLWFECCGSLSSQLESEPPARQCERWGLWEVMNGMSALTAGLEGAQVSLSVEGTVYEERALPSQSAGFLVSDLAGCRTVRENSAVSNYPI